MEHEVFVNKDELIPAVQGMLAERARLGTITCVDLIDEFELIYHFEPQEAPDPLTHVRARVTKGDTWPSITSIYPSASLAELEIQDHFDIQISGITLDFQRRFLRSKESPEAALLKPTPYELTVPTRHPAKCGESCPAGIDIPRYVRLIGEDRPADALAVIKQSLPFPGILGRVCFAPCENSCRQAKQEEPIAVRMLKRFAYDNTTYEEKVAAEPTGKRVAIIGSGPAGLTAAYYLVKMGHEVAVFEALPEAGGMMRVGIPAYRLPRKVLDEEIDLVKQLGAKIQTNTEVSSLEKLFQDGYQAILVATGAHRGMKLGLEGEDHHKMLDCIDFLRDVSFGKRTELGNRVAVIGGGNATIDAARSALRLGAKEVIILYRRTRAEMPANTSEIEEAISEGVKIDFLVAPRRIEEATGEGVRTDFQVTPRRIIMGKNDTVILESVRMKLGAPDASGRPRPEPIEGSEFQLEVDAIIAAIGQSPDVPQEFALETGSKNTVIVDAETMATSREGVFAAGDVITGPASVVEAVRSAKQATLSIDRYLGGEGVLPVPELDIKDLTSRQTFIERWARNNQRVVIPSLAIDDRLRGFDEVELGLTEEMATAEGRRCWRCDLEE